MNTREVSCDAPRALSGGMHEGQSPSGRGARSDGTLPPFALRMLARSLRGVGRVPRAVLLIPVAVGLLYGAEAFAQVPTQIRLDSSWGRTARTLSPSASKTTVTGSSGTVHPISGNLYKIAQADGKTAGVSRRSVSVPPTVRSLPWAIPSQT
jgi:hypothetical protein